MLKILSAISMCSLMLFTISCSSTKKATGVDAITDTNTEAQAGELKLNGDSDSGSAGSLQTIYFAFDSASLTQEAKETLKNNAEYLKAQSSVNVQIEGHCDERGGVQYNLALSEKRSKSVKDFLVALGVKSNRLATIGYGKERPVDLGHDEAAWAKNRRGNFVVTSL